MQAGLRDPGGLTKALGVSIIAHIAIIAAVAVLHRPDNRRFITPVYTMVSIVEPARTGGVPASPAATAAPLPVKTAVERPQTKPKTHEQAARPQKSKTAAKAIVKNTPPSKAAKIKAPAAQKADVDLALKKIKENVKKKADESLVASRIEDIKKGREGEAAQKTSAAVEDIRKRIATGETRPGPVNETGGAGTQGTSPVVAGNGPNASREALETRYHAYYALIRDNVQENWRYPYKDDKVMIIVSVKIFKDGRLISSEIEKSSGNALFDESLLSAIKKASPFAPLPQGFPNDYLEAELRFCPGCAQ
ncbi:MAG: cell envelope integrity protein TolA [Deltaproteobacteria bacterium]|nr:cell envelope integrity protein TolA [Deltaproteobacteria bacterium]